MRMSGSAGPLVPSNEEESIATIQSAIDAGITLFDTATITEWATMKPLWAVL
jgi:aryl-alcohol dehydrogenase-like predicted oxidoreductase